MIDQIRYFKKRKRNPAVPVRFEKVKRFELFGGEVLVELIGEGAYSRAYRVHKGEIKGINVAGLVLIESLCRDISKRTLSKLGPLPYMPKVISLGKEYYSCWYLMPYYRDIKAPYEEGYSKDDNTATRILNELRIYGGSSLKEGAAEAIRKADVPMKLKVSLLKVMNELYKQNKDVMIDVAKHNVGLDESGKFVCRDCFASEEH